MSAGEHEVLIKGKIDRMDVLELPEHGSDADDAPETAGDEAFADRTAPETAVRIVDYKTGGDAVDVEHFRSGYKLQLMLYLKAATQKQDVTRPECSCSRYGKSITMQM